MEALNTYTAEKTLAEKMNGRLAELRLSKAEAALRMNYSRPALSQYLNGKYASDPTELEKKIAWFLHETEPDRIGSRPDDQNIVGSITPPEGWSPQPRLKSKVEFFESRDFVQAIGVCQACQENMGIGIIVGRSGYGKTHALRKYAKLPRVVYIEGNETMNCKDIVRRIENKTGIPRSYGSIDERMERIVDFFNINQGYLLIMDEADKLINKYTQKKIELLRNISDSADLGIVIAGEPALETLLKSYDARFANRMDFYYKLKGLSRQEVTDYLEGYEVEESALAEFMSRANNSQSGCFRLLDRTLSNVLRILKERGETRVTMKIVSEASNMMML